MNSSNASPELLLEVSFRNSRSLIFRMRSDDGSVLYFEKSDIADFNKPVAHEEEMPLYYSLESAWKSILGFTSAEGFLNRSVWHEESKDWLKMTPRFIEGSVRPLIMRSLSEVSHASSQLSSENLDGLRTWIKEVAADQPIRLNRTPKTPNHVYAKRA
jgi:hypothetical protein